MYPLSHNKVPWRWFCTKTLTLWADGVVSQCPMEINAVVIVVVIVVVTVVVIVVVLRNKLRVYLS